MEILRPLLLDIEADKDKINELSMTATVIDGYTGMSEELNKINNPGLDKNELAKLDNGLYAKQWVYFPWRNTLISILGESDYFKVRTSRNKYLIGNNEQSSFRNSSICIAGLSVGNNVALTIAMTGGSNKMKLADPDVLDLSNMNRLRGSLLYLGKKKVELAAQQIWEIDPYADLSLWENGVSDRDIEEFVSGDNVDVAIDEMDDLRLKILFRIEARKKRIPVVMATDNDDGVMIDVERFDLEPERPIMHGFVKDIESMNLSNELTVQQRVDISSKLVGAEYISEKMMFSLNEVGKTIPTWPQLGTAAAVSGAVVAYVVRRIVSGQDMPSQRVLMTPNKSLHTD